MKLSKKSSRYVIMRTSVFHDLGPFYWTDAEDNHRLVQVGSYLDDIWVDVHDIWDELFAAKILRDFDQAQQKADQLEAGWQQRQATDQIDDLGAKIRFRVVELPR